MKIPIIQTAKSKPFFFAIWEGYRSAGNPHPAGRFNSLDDREQATSRIGKTRTGNLIPIYDPASTTIVNGVVSRKQFMGCNGNTPNVICPADPRIANSLAQSWLKHPPPPLPPGPLNNYALRIPLRPFIPIGIRSTLVSTRTMAKRTTSGPPTTG